MARQETGRLVWNWDGWDQLLKGVVAQEMTPRAERIAKACNDELIAAHPDRDRSELEVGYQAGTEGKPELMLHKHDYRATVITTTNQAKYDNAAHNRLVENFHHGEGAS